jgi:cytochrome c oxidase assembly protein Cox11
VTFVIEPGLPANLDTVTLSYTFFKVEAAAPTAARRKDGGASG